MLTIAHLNESAPAELNLTPIAVDVETAAKLMGVSPSTIRAHIKRSDLLVKYSGTKPVILMTELRVFAESLPSRPRKL
jgi:hypothetical protein